VVSGSDQWVGVWITSCNAVFENLPTFQIEILHVKKFFVGGRTKFYILIRPCGLSQNTGFFDAKIQCSPYLIPRSLLYN
jgi:hypothetical protein